MFDDVITDCEVSFKEHLKWRKKDYQYLYSVQPCIWNKNSMIEILEKYEEISLHDLDQTLPNIKNENDYFKSTACKLDSCFDHIDKIEDNYFVLAYVEICRHGVFNLNENGMPTNPNAGHALFAKKIIKEENLCENPEFSHLSPKL